MGFAHQTDTWSRLLYVVAERVLSLVSLTDLQTLRLVNSYWRHVTNVFVTHQRPIRLRQLFSLKSQFPKLTSVDISGLEIRNEQQLKLAASTLSQLNNLKQIEIRAAPDLTLENLASSIPELQRLRISPTDTLMKQDCESCHSLPLSSLRLDLFENLNFLDLSWNHLHEQITSHQLSRLSRLHGLNLRNCVGVGDVLVAELAAVDSIRSLNLSNTGITDDALMSLHDLGLECLNISHCRNVTDDGMFWLQYVRSLHELDISGCPEISSAGMEQISFLPKLKRLYLQEMKAESCCSSLKSMLVLEELSLRNCCWVTDAVLADLSFCKKLQFLNLRNCSNFTDHGLNSLLNLQDLQSINLRGCSQITDDGILTISKLTGLKELDLSFLNQITDNSLLSLIKIRKLRRLVLDWCNQITSNGLQKLKENCTVLQELSIKGCHSVESADLVLMTDSIKKLDFEHSLCSVSPLDKKQDSSFPLLHHIDSVGCFFGIC
eukprot:g2367.t1